MFFIITVTLWKWHIHGHAQVVDNTFKAMNSFTHLLLSHIQKLPVQGAVLSRTRYRGRDKGPALTAYWHIRWAISIARLGGGGDLWEEDACSTAIACAVNPHIHGVRHGVPFP